jgi:hypothetical protein
VIAEFKSTLFNTQDLTTDFMLPIRCNPTIFVLGQVIAGLLIIQNLGDDRVNQINILAKIHSFLGLCISAKLDLFADVISAFDLQDDVEKRENIFKKTQTQSNTEDGNGFSQYSYCLVNVLKTQPYSIIAWDWQGV